MSKLLLVVKISLTLMIVLIFMPAFYMSILESCKRNNERILCTGQPFNVAHQTCLTLLRHISETCVAYGIDCDLHYSLAYSQCMKSHGCEIEAYTKWVEMQKNNESRASPYSSPSSRSASWLKDPIRRFN